MFRLRDDFFAARRTLADGTLKILSALTDEALAREVGPGHRTLGGMAWHVVTTIPEMMRQTGLPLGAVDEKSLPPASAGTIVESYRTASEELAAAVAEHWTDEDLLATDDLYGETWPRGLTLAILIHHEIHHRGQMTVLMRQAGLRVPGIYGPAQEEWQQYGMPAPPY